MPSSLISQAWLHRFNARIEETKSILNLIENQDASSMDPKSQAEIHLLKASLARHALESEKAFSSIEQARQILQVHNQPESFQLHMQTALCLIANARHVDSLRLLQKSESAAQNDFERVIAKVNMAICCFNLNLPHTHLFSEIEELLSQCEHHPLQEAFEQLKIIALKKSFHEGRMHEVFNLTNSHLNQSLYFQAWASCLPWNSGKSSELRNSFIQKSIHQQPLFHGEYRLQTVLADPRSLNQSSASSSVFQLQVDRIYLWTWQWLVSPNETFKKMLEEELGQFAFDRAHLLSTDEDFLFLESALGWLAVFNSRFQREYSQWLEKYSPAQRPPSRFFDLDFKVRKLFEQESEFQKALTDIEKNFELPEYFSVIRDLAKIKFSKPIVSGSAVLVDPSRSIIKNSQKKLFFAPASEVLVALKAEKFLSFEEALEIAFSISGYDQIIHGPKINNLLQRIKPLLPRSVEIYTKNQKIFLDDPDDLVVVGNPHLQTKYFPEIFFSKFDKKQSAQHSLKTQSHFRRHLFLKFTPSDTFSRLDLQKELNLTKPTAVRLIAKWLADETLISNCRGSKSLYKIK